MLLDIPKLDSLRLLIPMHLIEVNNNHKEFLRKIITINSDGEILSEKEQKSYRLHSNPSSCHYQRCNVINNGLSEDTLKLGFSAKTIKADYFNGINKDNIDEILNFINSEGVIKINKRTLLHSKVVDTDVCIDMVLESNTSKDFFTHLYSMSDAKKDTIPNPFNMPTNKGIEWSHRNKVGKAYKTKQYLKFYDKHLELNNKSIVFYEAYLKKNPFINLVENKQIRVETTIKNSAHWKTYGIEIRTLEDLLNLNLNDCKEIFKRPLNHYLVGNKAIFHKLNLTPSDKKDLMLIDSLTKLYKIDESGAIELVCESIFPTTKKENKNPRSRQRKKLTELVLNNKQKSAENYNSNQLDIVSELEKINLL